MEPTPQPDMRVINPERPLTDEGRARVIELAQRQKRANGLLFKAINLVGNQLEDGLKIIPASLRNQIDTAARKALTHSYNAAAKSKSGALSRVPSSDGAHRSLGVISGALGGLGGLPTALAELPVSTTVIFRSVQSVAEGYGEDPLSEETRIECLRVFGSGGPGEEDDGVDTSFLSARMTLTGPAISGLINKIAPRFAAVISQKLASQSVPIIGAVAGAGTNLAFVNFYTEMAHVHFGLRALSREFDADEVADAFHAALHTPKIAVRRG